MNADHNVVLGLTGQLSTQIRRNYRIRRLIEVFFHVLCYLRSLVRPPPPLLYYNTATITLNMARVSKNVQNHHLSVC
jgi:hypothetical protein